MHQTSSPSRASSCRFLCEAIGGPASENIWSFLCFSSKSSKPLSIVWNKISTLEPGCQIQLWAFTENRGGAPRSRGTSNSLILTLSIRKSLCFGNRSLRYNRHLIPWKGYLPLNLFRKIRDHHQEFEQGSLVIWVSLIRKTLCFPKSPPQMGQLINHRDNTVRWKNSWLSK